MIDAEAIKAEIKTRFPAFGGWPLDLLRVLVKQINDEFRAAATPRSDSNSERERRTADTWREQWQALVVALGLDPLKVDAHATALHQARSSNAECNRLALEVNAAEGKLETLSDSWEHSERQVIAKLAAAAGCVPIDGKSPTVPQLEAWIKSALDDAKAAEQHRANFATIVALQQALGRVQNACDLLADATQPSKAADEICARVAQLNAGQELIEAEQQRVADANGRLVTAEHERARLIAQLEAAQVRFDLIANALHNANDCRSNTDGYIARARALADGDS